MSERLHAALCITSALIFMIGAAIAFFLIAGEEGNVALGTAFGAVSIANLVLAVLMYRKIGRRRWIVAAVVLILFGTGMFGIIELQKRYRIADIITDEAEWDLRDNAEEGEGAL